MSIDWTNPKEKVTPHFTVKDCLWLNKWGRLATEADGVDFNKILTLCLKLEEVREFLGIPMNIHCIFRSIQYNLEQGILKNGMVPGFDVHARSEAADFDCNGHLTIEEVKAKLEPELERLQIRMEFGTTTWLHLDTHSVGPSGRYFRV